MGREQNVSPIGVFNHASDLHTIPDSALGSQLCGPGHRDEGESPCLLATLRTSGACFPRKTSDWLY